MHSERDTGSHLHATYVAVSDLVFLLEKKACMDTHDNMENIVVVHDTWGLFCHSIKEWAWGMTTILLFSRSYLAF